MSCEVVGKNFRKKSQKLKKLWPLQGVLFYIVRSSKPAPHKNCTTWQSHTLHREITRNYYFFFWNEIFHRKCIWTRTCLQLILLDLYLKMPSKSNSCAHEQVKSQPTTILRKLENHNLVLKILGVEGLIHFRVSNVGWICEKIKTIVIVATIHGIQS